MERREFLKLTLGFAAAAGTMAATATAAQAVPTPLLQGEPTDPREMSARADPDKLEHESATQEVAAADGDTDFSARRWWRRRRVWWRRRRFWYRRRRRVFWRRRRRWWRRGWRRRRVIYY